MTYHLRNIKIRYLIFLVLIFSFIKPYVWEFQFIGKFPAENTDVGASKSYYRPILCIPDNDLTISTLESDSIHGTPGFEIIPNRDKGLYTPIVTRRLKESSDPRTPQYTLLDSLYNEIINIHDNTKKSNEISNSAPKDEAYFNLSMQYELVSSTANLTNAAGQQVSLSEYQLEPVSSRNAYLQPKQLYLSYIDLSMEPILTHTDHLLNIFSFTPMGLSTVKANIIQNELENPPTLKFSGNTKIANSISDTSDGVYYSKTENKFILLDDISGYDVALLWGQRLSRAISPEELTAVISDSNQYYQSCSTPPIRAGFTEGYWAAKGTGPLHHWVHLYESTVPGRTKLAQYGYTIPYLSKFISSEFINLNPSNFVKVSWILFCILGVVYIIIYLNMFKAIYLLACVYIMMKISIFYSFGPYYHTLAPGYHWFRELVLLAVVCLCVQIKEHLQINKLHSSRPKDVFFYSCSACLLILLYLTDPLYFIISTFSVFASLGICYYSSLVRLIRNSPKILFGFVLLIPIIAVYFSYSHAGKLIYIMDKFQNSDFGLFAEKLYYSFYVNSIIITCLVVAYNILNKPRDLLLCIFSLITAITSIYFYTQPDDAHFKKYVELNTPFFLLLTKHFVFDKIISKFNGFSWIDLLKGEETGSENTIQKIVSRKLIYLGNLENIILSVRNKISRSVIEGAVLVFCISGYVLINQNYLMVGTPQLERNIYDDFGNKYFVADSHPINNVLIEANMNENIVEHLSNYPLSVQADYVISNYDKYLTFLYDVRNGFDSPDFVAWLNSSKRYDETLTYLLHSDRKIKIVIDRRIMSIDPRNSLKSNHSWAGGLAKAANLNLKARYRVAEIAINVANTCQQITENSSHQDWLVFECNN